MSEAGQQWDTGLYDAHHSFVTRYGADLLDLLNPQPGERILDLGCGTGHLTQQIAASGVTVVGMDHAAAMVEQARANYPQLTFFQGNAAHFQVDSPFTAVLSNAVLHWVLTPEQVLASVYAALLPDGRFVAEFGGQGNIALLSAGILAALDSLGCSPPPHPVWYFPSPAAYATLLEAAGFRVALLAHFDRPTRLDGEHGLRNWVAMFGGPLLVNVPPDARAALVEAAEERLRPTLYRDGAWYADYVRLRVVAVKTAG